MPTILLVDDEHAILENFRQLLERRGYTVLCAESAENALGVCAQCQETIDILLCDMALKPLNGVQLAVAIKVQYPSLAVVLMSGLPAEYYPDCRGEDLFLQKPFGASELFEVIDRASALASVQNKKTNVSESVT